MVIANGTRVKVESPNGTKVEGVIKSSIGGFTGIIYVVEFENGARISTQEVEVCE